MKQKIIEVLKSFRDTVGFEDQMADAIINEIIVPVDKENLPDENQIVLCFSQYNYCLGRIYIDEEERLLCSDLNGYLFAITHYMEIIKP